MRRAGTVRRSFIASAGEPADQIKKGLPMTSLENPAIDPITQTSADIFAERIAELRDLFPEAFSEGRVDFERLRAALGDLVDDRPERYQFTWAGKRDAQRILQMPTRATLVPCPEESIDTDTTDNVFIEGDNLEVLKLLLKPYYGRVKMIYIDPPYNTGNDFIYPDNYRDPLDTYLRLTGQVDAEGNVLTSNPETSGRYHSAWLSMMYPRLFLARQLLREDGVIFVSIDDHEVHNLRLLMNELFGEENFVATVIWQKKQSPQNDAINLSDMHDYILVYAKNMKSSRNDPYGWQVQSLPRTRRQDDRYSNPDSDPRGDWTSVDYTCNKTATERPNLYYEIINPHTGQAIWPSRQRVWYAEKQTHEQNARENKIWWGSGGDNFPRLKRFRSEVSDGVVPSTWWDRAFAGDNQQARRELRVLFNDVEDTFDTPKPVRLLRRMLQIATIPHEEPIIMDFFSGSSTAAQAVLEQNKEDGGNRHFIMVQLPEPTGSPDFPTIADIGKERIRRVIARLKAEREGQLPLDTREAPEDLGFRVFKLTPSNLRIWSGVEQADPAEYARRMALFADPLEAGWTPEKVIAEVALKEAGFGLNYRVEPVTAVAEQTVYRVTDPDREQQFAICLDDRLRLGALDALTLSRDDLFVCRASALDDDTAANLALQCRLKVI